jgi:outer membrane protein OmpA-like peptidoglycan-associated protein
LTPTGGGSAAAVKIAAVAIGVLVVAVGAFFGVKQFTKRNAGDANPTPEVSASSGSTASATPDPDAGASNGTTASTTPAATPAPSTPEPPPAAPQATDEPATDAVKKEVLARIDTMPNLPDDKKDRLYNSVQRAREMRKIVEIQFASGQTEIPANFAPEVKKLLEAEQVQKKFRDDLTAVFVVLGFADTKGDPQTNLRVSETRAKNVVKFMETTCGVKNVMHSVAMGSTTLVNKNNTAKNRVAEIWAVLP